jgi:hypothetical protein
MESKHGVDTTDTDLGSIEHKWDARPRPYPYTTDSTLSVTSSAITANVFGTAVKIIPKTTFDFGDSPNLIQISGIIIESMSDNGVYVLELLRDTTPIGAVRFNRTSTQVRSFLYLVHGREIDADVEDVYAKLKSTPANLTVTFSVLIRRHIATGIHVPASTGTWPEG